MMYFRCSENIIFPLLFRILKYTSENIYFSLENSLSEYFSKSRVYVCLNSYTIQLSEILYPFTASLRAPLDTTE